LEDIENIIQLLRIPFINAISEIDKNKFVFTLEKRDLSNTFFQISQLISSRPLITTTKVISEEPTDTKTDVEQIDEIEERTIGTKYYKWTIRGTSLFATAREENPYEHSCPVDHFKTIMSKIIEAFENQNVINNDIIYQALVDQELSPNRVFKGKAEEYKIRMILGVLELEGLTKWTGSLRPIEYTLDKPLTDLIKWSNETADKK